MIVKCGCKYKMWKYKKDKSQEANKRVENFFEIVISVRINDNFWYVLKRQKIKIAMYLKQYRLNNKKIWEVLKFLL